MKMKILYTTLAVAAFVLLLFLFQGIIRSVFVRTVHVVRGRRTVAERIDQYGPAARSRLNPYFERLGVAYPPEGLIFVGLKQERLLEIWLPAGLMIKEEFFRRLEERRLKIVRHDLMQLKHFTRREIELFRIPLIYADAWVVMLDRWMKRTGGIDGEPYGLEIDAKARNEWKEIFRRKARPYLNDTRRRAAMPCIEGLIHEIQESIEEFHQLTREQMRRRLYADVDRFIDGVYGRG